MVVLYLDCYNPDPNRNLKITFDPLCGESVVVSHPSVHGGIVFISVLGGLFHHSVDCHVPHHHHTKMKACELCLEASLTT